MALSSVLLCVHTLLLAAALVPQVARAYPDGPPVKEYFSEVCDLMRPKHHDDVPKAGTGGYSIETDLPRNGHIGFNYTAGKDYTGEKSLQNNNSSACPKMKLGPAVCVVLKMHAAWFSIKPSH